jgi:hypothetical protein
LIIQSHWRGLKGRRVAALARARAAQERRLGRVERLRQMLAATRIQRYFRRYRKVRRARAGIAASEAAAAAAMGPGRIGSATATTTPEEAVAGSSACPWSNSSSSSNDRGTKDTSLASQKPPAAAAAIPPHSDNPPGEHRQRSQAATVIQASVRGWLVRRSDGLWWRQRLHGLRGRRAAVHTWQQHRKLMGATYELQQQVGMQTHTHPVSDPPPPHALLVLHACSIVHTCHHGASAATRSSSTGL